MLSYRLLAQQDHGPDADSGLGRDAADGGLCLYVLPGCELPTAGNLSPKSSDREQYRGEDDGAAVDEGVLVVAAGVAAPLLEPVERALDDAALL